MLETPKKKLGIDAFWLKIIAAVLMTLDHIGLLFCERGAGNLINADYYALRAIGKMAFPIFAFLAIESLFKTKSELKYLARLGISAGSLFFIALIIGFIADVPLGKNLLLGNAFIDIFMGVLMIYFLKKKSWYSLLAVFPFLYELFSEFYVSPTWGTLFKADWGFFGICIFLMLYLGRLLADQIMKDVAAKSDIMLDAYKEAYGQKFYNVVSAISLLVISLIFYLIYRIDNSCFLLTDEFVPIGTYSCLSGIFFLFYNGRRGYSNKWIRASFYLYYPLHIALLGVLSLFFGVLS